MQGAVLVDPMFARHDDVDTVAATLTFSDGTLGVLTGGRHDPLGYDIRMELFGSKDVASVGWDARMPMHSLEPGMPPAPDKPYAFFLDRFDAAYRAELTCFVDVARGRAENPCSVEDAEAALRVALACDQSRREHRPVRVRRSAGMSRAPIMRIAGAPITWGVCEVPGWGLQLEPDLVLQEIASAGLTATELGPRGFLATEPAEARAQLASHGLTLVAGFVPAVLHRASTLDTQLQLVQENARTLAGAGAEILVLAAETGAVGYESSLVLDDREWETFRRGLAAVEQIGKRHGLLVALHPHYGTLIENEAQVRRLLDSTSVPLCLDTGHLLVGGSNPLQIAKLAVRPHRTRASQGRRCVDGASRTHGRNRVSRCGARWSVSAAGRGECRHRIDRASADGFRLRGMVRHRAGSCDRRSDRRVRAPGECDSQRAIPPATGCGVTTAGAPFDVLTMGRVGIDLYPTQSDVPLAEIETFQRFLGGSATNVAVAAARYGRRSAVITKVGTEGFGPYVHSALRRFGVDDRFVGEDENLKTPIVFCELHPPDHFPIVFYRQPKAPDLNIHLGELDLDAIRDARVFWTTGTGLCQEPSRSATLGALEARARRRFTVHDLDFRPMFWSSAAGSAPMAATRVGMRNRCRGQSGGGGRCRWRRGAGGAGDASTASRTGAGVPQARP